MTNPNFPNNPEYNIYVGARYVPIFSGEWDETKRYENLEIVNYKGEQYTSKSYVPVGTPPTDETYWAKSADFNPELDALQKQVENHEGRITENEAAIEELQNGVEIPPDLLDRLEAVENGVDSVETDVATLQTSQSTQDTKIAASEAKIAALEMSQTTQDGKISANKVKISSLETSQTAQDTKIAANEAKITGLETSQATQDGRLGNLENTLGTHADEIDALKTSQGEQDTKITSLTDSVGTLTTAVENLETVDTAQQAEIETLKGQVTQAETDIGALQTENQKQQDSIDALKAASGELPEELEKIYAKDREQDAKISALEAADAETKTSLDSLNEAQTEVQNQLSALEDGSVPLPYVKLSGDNMTGALNFKNKENEVLGSVGLASDGSLMVSGGGVDRPTHITLAEGSVAIDKPVAVNGTVSGSAATADNMFATLGQVNTLTDAASGSAAEALEAAQAAQTTANAAQTAAAAAQQTADGATTAAGSAQTVAGTANAAAGAAQTAANNASAQASAAQTTATEAKTLAVAAQTAADGKLSRSGTEHMNGTLWTAPFETTRNAIGFHGPTNDTTRHSLAFYKEPNTTRMYLQVANGDSGDAGKQVRLKGLADPVAENDACNKAYADTKLSVYGGTLINGLFINTPIRGQNAIVLSSPWNVNRAYLYFNPENGDKAIGSCQNRLDGGAQWTFTGLADPEQPHDAVNKLYVDNAVASAGGGIKPSFGTRSVTVYVNGASSGTAVVEYSKWSTGGHSFTLCNAAATLTLRDGDVVSIANPFGARVASACGYDAEPARKGSLIPIYRTSNAIDFEYLAKTASSSASSIEFSWITFD